MKTRTLFWIVTVVLLVHAAGFLVLMQLRAARRPAEVAPPNFGVREITYVNATTGEKTVVRELKVSTKLTPRAMGEESVPEKGAGTPSPP